MYVCVYILLSPLVLNPNTPLREVCRLVTVYAVTCVILIPTSLSICMCRYAQSVYMCVICNNGLVYSCMCVACATGSAFRYLSTLPIYLSTYLITKLFATQHTPIQPTYCFQLLAHIPQSVSPFVWEVTPKPPKTEGLV